MPSFFCALGKGSGSRLRGQRHGEWTAVAAVVGGVVAGFGDGTGGQGGSCAVQQQGSGITGQKLLCFMGLIVPEIPDALCVLQDGDLRRGGAGTFRQAPRPPQDSR